MKALGNGSRPLKPEEEGIAGGFEAWTLWGEVSATMVSDSTYIPPYMDLTGKTLPAYVSVDKTVLPDYSVRRLH